MNDFVNGPPFFIADRAARFERPEGTCWLFNRKESAGRVFGDSGLTHDWAEKQRRFIRWTRDAAMFNQSEVAQNYALYSDWFSAHPARRLVGRVLDIGGGWGLFREWWTAGESGCFVVHDPGVERFTSSPPETLRRQFAIGLARPAWFVEGFGEDLPYRDGSYDTVAIISALDHCAQPGRVLAEALRVLRTGGRLFIIQGFDPKPDEHVRGRSFASRLARVLSDPQTLNRAIRQRLFHRGDPHMSHFTLDELKGLMVTIGFNAVRETVVSERFGVAVIEARSGN